MTQTLQQLKTDSITLLQRLIATPSVSRDETAAADLLQQQLTQWGLNPSRQGNNIWVRQKECPHDKPVILLNSHIDTVKPANGYTRDPYTPTITDGKLYGLGSNDAGGPLVSLIAAYRHLITTQQPYQLILAATAEEEVSGKAGIESILPALGNVNLAIIGEPTSMQPAIAEKGLIVLDCTTHGQSGHAARNQGINAIYKAIPDINWFQTHQFPKISQYLGPVKMSVTQINAGTQHNVIPDTCSYVVDIRVNELYTNQDIIDTIKTTITSDVKPRSTRLTSSSINTNHPIVRRATQLGLKPFGSPTMSDQALIPFTSIKIGPGDSERSHTADEYIHIQQINDGIDTYIALLDGLQL